MRPDRFAVLTALSVALPVAIAQSLHNETSAQVPLAALVSGATDAFTVNQGEHFRGEAAAQALAGFGVLKIGGTARTSFYVNDGLDIFQSSFESQARSKARFFDYLTFSGQSAGTAGVLALDVLLRGEQTHLAAGPWGFADTRWQFDLRIGGQPFHLERIAHGSVNPIDGPSFEVLESGNAFAQHRIEVPIIFGRPVSLDVRLEGSATANVLVTAADGSFEGHYDLTRSAYWGGIAGVTVGGQAVDFSVSAASGTDYRGSMVPIPEPRSVVLFGFGLIGLLVWRAGYVAGIRPAVGRGSPT